MKISKLFILIIGAWLFIQTSALRSQTADLTIQISGIEVLQGKIQIGLYDNSDDFPKESREFISLALIVDSTCLVHTIPGLPYGDYSIAIYHDINDDGKCNRNWIGIPTESFGFSKNVRVRFSAPSFEKTKFSLMGHTEIAIRLKN